MHPSSHLVAHPEELLEFQRPPAHIYSRYTSGARQRAEQVLSKLMRGHAVTYASGLNAAYAVAVHTQPTVIALRRGYFGCHEAFNVYAKTKGNLVSRPQLQGNVFALVLILTMLAYTLKTAPHRSGRRISNRRKPLGLAGDAS